MEQLDLFSESPRYPTGFRYAPGIITREDEAMLLRHVQELAFAAFEFHGFTGKRRTVSFGKAYDFNQEKLLEAPVLPAFLFALRDAAAAFAGVAPAEFVHVLVT